MDVYSQIAEKIIEQQESIIGPVAIERAKQVNGLRVDWANKTVSISGDASKTIDALVEIYRELFGQISVEVCRDAAAVVSSQMSDDKLPVSLR